MGRIGEADFGADPATIFENGELWDKSHGVDANSVSDGHVVLDHCAASDTDIVTDLVVFPEQNVMTSLKAMTDDIPSVDHSVAP